MMCQAKARRPREKCEHAAVSMLRRVPPLASLRLARARRRFGAERHEACRFVPWGLSAYFAFGNLVRFDVSSDPGCDSKLSAID